MHWIWNEVVLIRLFSWLQTRNKRHLWGTMHLTNLYTRHIHMKRPGSEILCTYCIWHFGPKGPLSHYVFFFNFYSGLNINLLKMRKWKGRLLNWKISGIWHPAEHYYKINKNSAVWGWPLYLRRDHFDLLLTTAINWKLLLQNATNKNMKSMYKFVFVLLPISLITIQEAEEPFWCNIILLF